MIVVAATREAFEVIRCPWCGGTGSLETLLKPADTRMADVHRESVCLRVCLEGSVH